MIRTKGETIRIRIQKLPTDSALPIDKMCTEISNGEKQNNDHKIHWQSNVSKLCRGGH